MAAAETRQRNTTEKQFEPIAAQIVPFIGCFRERHISGPLRILRQHRLSEISDSHDEFAHDVPPTDPVLCLRVRRPPQPLRVGDMGHRQVLGKHEMLSNGAIQQVQLLSQRRMTMLRQGLCEVYDHSAQPPRYLYAAGAAMPYLSE